MSEHSGSQHLDERSAASSADSESRVTTPKPIRESAGLSRRGLLSAGGALGLTARLGLGGAAIVGISRSARADALGPLDARKRARTARDVRDAAALWQIQQPPAQHPDNGDEELYPNDLRGTFTKGLPHDDLGIVDAGEYQLYRNALASGKHEDFELITMGNFSRFVSPQAAYSFHLEGPDSHALGIPAAPTFASARTAAEMVEHYWQALTRDVPFRHYDTDPLIAAACADLSQLSDYGGPTLGGVIPQILFRHSGFIDAVGPYVSQFLWKKIPFGAMDMDQRYKVPVAGDDYATTYPKFLEVQAGFPQAADNQFQSEPRFLCNARDLTQYVHKDFHYQAFLNAAHYLSDLGGSTLAPTNPLKNSVVQGGYVTWGRAMANDLVARAAWAALKAGWFQKWCVHRRLRPEKYGAFVHNHLNGVASYDMHPDVLNSQALAQVFSKFGTYLMPSAYPECAPLHPAYPSGHAVFSGACATIIKALFDENYVIPSPLEANEDGTQLLPYTGPALTVRGEIDKLAFNIGMGRAGAGIHWRSDLEDGLRLGEEVAKKLLHDLLETFNEPFTGFQFTGFDGIPVTIS